VLVGFPATIVTDTDIDLVITYSGRLPPQGVDREAVRFDQERVQEDVVLLQIDPQFLYSNRSYWYPQSPVTGYATGRLTITIPAEYEVVASGTLQGPATVVPSAPGLRGRRTFVFDAARPTRYFACLISRFLSTRPMPLKLRDDADPMTLTVMANPRLSNRVRSLGDKAADILKFYSSLMADAPYDGFTLALTESELPGGHSPAYFAILNQPLPQSPFVWTNDPVAFPSYPSFFIAHEVAHQWRDSRSTSRRSMPGASVVRSSSRPFFARCGGGPSTPRRRVPSISAIASDTSGRRDGSSARSFTTRARWCCTCCGA
jgi:hypothetical protein